MASTGPVLLSDGNLRLEPEQPIDEGSWAWTVMRARGHEGIGRISLGPAGSHRLQVRIEVDEGASSADVQAMAQALRLACRWASTAGDVVAVAWLGPTSQTLRAIVHQAGFRVHPFPHRGAWEGAHGPEDAWYADLVPEDEPGDTGSEAPRLTTREQHVLAHMARGRSNAQIAEQLGISENTVKNHVRAILDNLQEPSRTAAVVYALRSGLVSLDES